MQDAGISSTSEFTWDPSPDEEEEEPPLPSSAMKVRRYVARHPLFSLRTRKSCRPWAAAKKARTQTTLWHKIVPGWYGMENGQKTEMGKSWKLNGKGGSAGQGQNIAKERDFWGSFHVYPFSDHFLGHFCPSAAGGRFPFFPFLAFGRFPCHTSPAWS